jgi:hypothetical protein
MALRFWLMIVALCPTAIAQSFTIDWFTIYGGGGTSSGGTYSVTGTIGQANTGVASGGAFTVISGFWPGIVAESGVLPRLDIRWESNHVVLSWPQSSPGYLLQEGVPGEWSDVTEPAVQVGDDNELTVSITTTHRFFRLRRL